MNIDKVKFRSEFAKVITPLEVTIFNLESSFDISDFLIKVNEKLNRLPDIFSINDILVVYDMEDDEHYYWSLKNTFIGKACIQSSIDFVPETKTFYDHTLKEPLIVFGDMVVKGNFVNESELLVIGNVLIDGFWSDFYFNHARTSVVGNFTVGKGLLSEGMLSVGGKMKSELCYLSFNQGQTHVLNGLESTLLFEFQHSGSLIIGTVTADYISRNKLKTQFPIIDNGGALLNCLEDYFSASFLDVYKAKLSQSDDEFDKLHKLRNSIYENLESTEYSLLKT